MSLIEDINIKNMLSNKGLSLKDKGLLCLLLDNPEVTNIQGIRDLCNNGISSIRSSICILQDKGFLTQEAERINGRIVGYHYKINLGER